MRSVKRILAVYLTFAMAFQLFAPTTGALAEEMNVVSGATAQQPGSSEGADGSAGGSSADAGAASGDDASSSGDASADGSETASDDAASGDVAAGDASESQEPAADESASADDDAADAQDAPATVAAGATITTVDELKKAMEVEGHGVVTATGDTVSAIRFKDAVALYIISNADPRLYQTADLANDGYTGGALDLSSPVNGYTFYGLGSEAYPFNGSFDTKNTSIALATSLFNNVELNSGINIPNLIWKGEGSEPVIAANVAGAGQDLTVTIQIDDPVGGTAQESAAGITSALFGTVTGQLTLSATYSFTGTRKGLGAKPDATGNVGLLANTVKNGEFTVKSVDFLNHVVSGGTVTAASGNAGLLVGEVKDGATLRVGSLSNVPIVTIGSSNGSAGGVVGRVGSSTGATVGVTSEINLSSLTVNGGAAAGGFIGQATKLTLGADNKKVICPKTVGDEKSGNVGGFIGEVSFGSSVAFTGNEQIDTGDGVTLAGKVNDNGGVGAVFGKLAFIDSAPSVSFTGGEFKSSYSANGREAVFGGLVGNVMGETGSKAGKKAPSTLKVENLTTMFSLEGTTRSAGGIAGWVGGCNESATLEIKKSNVCYSKMTTPSQGFGGVVGCLDNYSILDINGLTVQNSQNSDPINKGAGVAAECWGAAIRLGGETDFSNMSFAENGNVAQIALVRSDNPTLVFARGTGKDTDKTSDDSGNYWVYNRCPATKIDDLGGAKNTAYGYGEVIRLDDDKLPKDLIRINASTHKLEGPSTDWSWQVGYDRHLEWSKGNRVLNINNTQDFVCLALSVQFANLWNGVYGLDPKNKEQLLGSDVTINLNADVNLSGTGVVGLGFDSANNLQTFKGTFNGNNHKITLAIGEPYGMRGNTAIESVDTTAGNGKIYRHSRLGLFAAIGGGATVNDLTVDGSIKFDNGLGVDAGSLAATITGNATLSGVTCKPAIACDDTFGNDVNIGGIAGSVRGGGTVTFDSSNTSGSTKAHSTINAVGASDGNNKGATLNGNTRIGGAIGYVADVAATVNVAGLEVGGATGSDNAITASDSASSKIAQVGGFIGCIAQSTYNEKGEIVSSAEKNVNITGLSFNSFDMTVGKNGDAKNGAGGLLGYSWGNAVVTIGDSGKNTSDSTYALKTNNASIAAISAGELGGLVYAASGHWIINDYAIDLSGTTINADKAKVLGLLIGRGSRVENSATYGAETYSGLYLENRASWDTAYKVHDDAADNGVAIKNTAINSQDSETSFDEWVGNSRRPAYGTKAGSKLMDGEWNTVVSLHTKDAINDGKLDMSGVPAQDNSYHNRSDFGKKHNTNAWTRYYYNLDKAYAKVGNNPKNSSASNWMDSPEYLLLWCAYLYAPSKIRSYIIPGNQQIFQGNKIGAEDGQRASIDMDGYSFYPSNPVNGSKVTVKNAEIKFHYSEIKAKQDGNKKNSEATQHENMHCGLIRTHAGDLTVSNVTLGGTVGAVVNDAGSSSGALICRYIYGSSTSTLVRQISIDGLTLDGLTVDGAANKTYAPLLINEMQTYVNLSANNISTTGYADNTKAATSLFGKLGVGSAADQVTATFSLINLPSAKDNTIFTRASLLESFGYGEGKTGSAVYTFIKADQDNSKVTFGSEIDANEVNNEYVGKQLWYYDEEGYGTDDNLVKVGSTVADKTGKSPKFGDYLPYVNTGKANNNNVQYHEIKVNQRVPNLTTGCGTYGDPYSITKATELNAVAEYINTQNPSDGWEVAITVDQETLCQRRSSGVDTGNEVTYVYKQAKKTWEKKTGEGTTDPNTTLADATMHTYLQSAYYSIEPVDDKGAETDTLKLDAALFQGLGNLTNPFRGVIVGDLAGSGTQATIAINNSTSFSRGLIPYSYGSVVKNLKVDYQSNVSAISYTGKDSNYASGSFFGGVIGCILGGDNIIDGVRVSSRSGSAATIASANTDPLITAVADSLIRSHLVPIGGYVGAVAGGGVIFRNSSNVNGALNPWHVVGADASRYDNPYVGRVIDGYAFSELTGSSLDNTDRNYKINNLINNLNAGGAQCIVTDVTEGRYRGVGSNNNQAITTTVNNAQGLLVLSAIISSGAAGGSANTKTVDDSYGTYAGSRAYLGGKMSTKNAGYQFGNQNYGKVRNADYKTVGQPFSADVEADFAVASRDDRLSPGSQNKAALDQDDGSEVNSPYLVSEYATWQTGNICAAQASGMDLQFKPNTTYDMTPYGTGYTGLSGRYYSNACASDKGADRDRIVPLVATINGNGATIKVGDRNGGAYDIKEYTDDDYRLTGVGALFGTVTYTSTNVGRSVANNNDYTVRNLNFKNCNISLTYTDASGKASVSGDAEIGVGLLAGTTANNSSLANYGKYSTITMTNCKVGGPNSVGGLLGSSGYGSRSTDKNDKTWIVNKTGGQTSPVKLYNCSYSNMEISGIQNVGGFVGKINSGSQGGIWTTHDTGIAQDSTITASSGDPRVGGVFGVSGGALFVNADTTTKESIVGGKATISGVMLTVPTSAGKVGGVGGLVGKAENSIYTYNLTVTGDTNTKVVFGRADAGSFKNVGGIAGNITNGNEFTFDTCEVSNINLKSREVSGGISGNISGSPVVTCNNVVVSGVTFGSSYAGGINGSIGGTPTFNITNIKIENNIFENPSNMWEGSNNQKSRSGGICGDGKGVFKISNVLFDSNDFQGKNGQGLVFGDTKTKIDLQVYAAGIDIKPIKGKTTSDLPPLMFDTTKDQSNVKQVNTVSYVAFGNYEDKFPAPGNSKTLYSDDSNGATEAISPCVTTSPVSDKIAVRVSDADTADRYLFGDGANVDLASIIQDQAGKDVAGRYTYTNIGGRDDSGAYRNTNGYNANATSAQSYNSENSDTSKQVATDFTVLEIPGQDTTTVTNYLNLVTNGGFSDAVRLNGGSGKQYVTAKAEKFELKQKGNDKVFVKSSDPASLSVVGNGTNSMQFRASSNWDNDKGQFTLLSVTFNDGAGHTYKVQVPIVVKRLFEVNFAATYTYGTNFKADDYSSKNAHVLTGVGDAMTGYLTWTYNKARATETEYGWNTYLQGGGSMEAPNKTLLFGGDGPRGTLPAGTQLTLVDTANNNKEYHYTVGPDGAASVALTDFAYSDGSDVKHYYEEQWLSELMGVKASDPTASGAWVKTKADDPNVGARIKTTTGYDYFRPWVSGDTGDRFDLALGSSSEPHPSESFFLVVRVPQGSAATVNGYTGTSLSSGVNTRINYVKRSNEGETDSHDNTASTYSVASGYNQTLVDNRQNADGTEGTQVMSVDTTNFFTMDVTDIVDCGKNEYNSSDTLYYQLNSSLASYNGSGLTGASGYPSGTSGTYSFYVKVGDTFYTPSKSTDSAGNVKWTWTATGKGEAAVSGKSWSADGGDMQLVLSDSEGTPIDLSGIREIARGATNATGVKPSFSIQLKASLQMSGPACQNAIAASEDASAYTKPTYRSFLSPHADTLSTSTMAKDNEGKMRYYRKGGGASTIALTATKKTQLGINVDDLGTADGTIALAATYDLSKLSGAEEKLSKAENATFTLTLQKRNDKGGYDSVPIADYLSVRQCTQLGMDNVGVSDDRNSIVFTDAASNSVLATRDGSSPILRLGFVVKVNTDVELAQHFYANYRLVMTAHLSGSGVDDTPVNASGSIAGYANSDYVTYTLTRVHMEGISHG